MGVGGLIGSCSDSRLHYKRHHLYSFSSDLLDCAEFWVHSKQEGGDSVALSPLLL